MTTPASLLDELDELLRSRLAERNEGSYSVKVLTDPVFAQRKIMEEAFEVCLELRDGPADRDSLAGEAADLVFHLLAGVIGAGGSWADIEAVLAERFGAPARHSTYAAEEGTE